MATSNLSKQVSMKDSAIRTSSSIHNGQMVTIDVVAFPHLAAMTTEERTVLEKRLRWKVDLRLLPMLILIYIMNYLDRYDRLHTYIYS